MLLAYQLLRYLSSTCDSMAVLAELKSTRRWSSVAGDMAAYVSSLSRGQNSHFKDLNLAIPAY